MSHFLLASSYFLHLVATAVWLGGMALLVLIIWPAQKGSESPLIAAIERRFRTFSNFSLLVLLVTGVVQTGQEDDYNGLLTFDTPWSQAILAKHIAFFGMVAIVGFLQFGLASTLERARLLKKAEEIQQLQDRERRLTRINLVLGVVVLIFTAIATAQ